MNLGAILGCILINRVAQQDPCLPHSELLKNPRRRLDTKKQVEIFSAGCPLCQAVIDLVDRLAGPKCKVTKYDLRSQRDAVEVAKT